MTDPDAPEDDHSEWAIEAMGVYLCQGIYDVHCHKITEPHQSVLVAAYMQGAAAIQAAELTAQALDRLAAAITLSASPARGTA